MKFLLFILLVFPMVACFAAESSDPRWEFPWAKGVSPLSLGTNSAIIDGYEANTLELKGKGICVGGPIDTLISFENGSDKASMDIDLLYRPESHAGVYLYRSGVFAPSNDDTSFTAFVKKLEKQASHFRNAQVEFCVDDSGQLKIHPDNLINTRSAFYDPSAGKEQGVVPRILERAYYELKYRYLEGDEKRAGLAIFVYLEDYVFCVSMDCPESRLAVESELLKKYLMSLYLVPDTQKQDAA